MPPSHKPVPAPLPDDAEPIELDAELLVPDTDVDLPGQTGAAPDADELPAGLGWHVSRQWARLRPHARALWYATAPALSALGRWTARAAAGALPLARRLWQHPLWQQRIWQPLRRRWHALTPGWPTSWRRLLGLAAGAFVLGALFVLPFALAGRKAAPSPLPPVALERPPAAASPAAATLAAAPAPATPDAAPRGAVGRQMAREAFEQQRWQDGVWYFRTARRAQRRAPDDDVLILSTIAALADKDAAPAAKRLLRELRSDARPLLVETARSHPDPVVRGHVQQLIRPAPARPFLRWVP
jgi:hypothetical protein